MDYLIAKSKGEIKSRTTYPMEPRDARLTIPKEIKDELGISGTVSVRLIGMDSYFTLSKIRELKIISYRF